MQTRAVLFDFYGTLASHGDDDPWSKVLDRWGYTLDREALRAWGEAHDGIEHAEASTSREAYLAWNRSLRRELLLACGVRDEHCDEVGDAMEAVASDQPLTVYPETVEVLEAVRQTGVVVAVCSNWDWDLDHAVRGANLEPLVDVQVTSARAGARKPHRRIYDVTLDAVGVDPAEALFVGDSFGPDVLGPVEVGMRAVHVWRRDDREPPPLPDNAWRVPDLRGVLDLL